MKRTYIGIVAAMVALGARQATPCQLQQAGPIEDLLDKSIQNQDDMLELASQIDAERASLKQQILDLLANNAPLQAKAQTLFDKSEAAENKLRAGLPGLPPVGGTPLLNSYDTAAEFDAARAAYTGPEAVNLDGIEVKTGSAPALEYFTHSDGTPAGVINTTGTTS